MRTAPFLSRRARWAVPGGVAAVVAGTIAGSAITVAQAAPALPSRTAAQLLAAAGGTAQLPPLTGTVVETARLGIPQLPGGDSPSSITSLLTGSHTLKVWYADPRHIRLAAPVSLNETDFILDGSTAWLWQSSDNSATKYPLPAGGGQPSAAAKKWKAATPVTPQQAAKRVLAAVGPTTRVTTQSNVMVAGQAAYQLVLAPRDSRSLVGRVTIALDGSHPNVPLRVQVFARGASSPAYQVGYTSISFVKPAAANFAFTPPPGAQVKTMGLPGQKVGASTGQGAAPQVIGKDWLSVAVLPASSLAGLSGGNPAGLAGQAARSAAGQGGSGPNENLAILGALMKSAAPVSGTWGSGKLLTTSLLSVLVTNDGRVLFGAVTPQVLYSAAAQAK